MKKITRCYGCKRIIRVHGSYTASMREEEVIGGIITGKYIDKEVNLCRNCAYEAGYKVKLKELQYDK